MAGVSLLRRYQKDPWDKFLLAHELEICPLQVKSDVSMHNRIRIHTQEHTIDDIDRCMHAFLYQVNLGIAGLYIERVHNVEDRRTGHTGIKSISQQSTSEMINAYKRICFTKSSGESSRDRSKP